MFTEETLKEAHEARKTWEEEVEKATRQKPERRERFSTVSDLEIKRIYTPEDIKDLDFAKDILVIPAFSRLPGDVNPQCIEGGYGLFACFLEWVVLRILIKDGITCLRKVRQG